ncbi:pilus assembly protein, partial [Acinetobacter baumannii]
MEHACMAGSRPWRATGVALLVFFSLLGVNEVSATSLQVAPTSLQLEARQRAGELWLTNSGTSPVKLQVRVFRWIQQDGKEQLLPTEDLLATPPMQELAAGQQQLVRVMRAVADAPAAQQYYRLIVDEVPD